MWNLKEKKVGIKYYDTVPVIEEKSKVIEKPGPVYEASMRALPGCSVR